MKKIVFGLFLALFASNCQQNQPAQAAAPAPAETAPMPATGPNFAAAGIDDVAAFKTFFEKMQAELIEPTAKEKLADLVAFPIRLAENREEFLKNYDAIVTEKVRAAVKNQKFDELFCRDMGAMFGAGELWVAPTGDGKFAVIGINP